MQKIRAGIITAAFILATMLTTTSAASAAPSAADGKRVSVSAEHVAACPQTFWGRFVALFVFRIYPGGC
jgi:hypothetical protein